MFFDELAQQYFNSPDEFAAAVKLLQQYKDAVVKYTRFEDLQARFFDRLDDTTGQDSTLLGKAIDHEAAKQLTSAGSALPPPSEITAEILDAIRNQHKAHIKSIPLAQAFDEYIKDRKPNWKDLNTEEHYRNDIFKLFHELVGDISTGDIDKSHATIYKQAVLKWPANRRKQPKYKDLSAQQILSLDVPEDEQFSPRNKQKYLQRLSGFLQWLEKHDYAVANIHAPLQKAFKNSSVAHEERNQYSCEDLRKLFNSRQYREGSHREPYQFWVPLIGLFTGARLNEICQLHISDIYQHKETEIWVFDINQDNAQETLKSIKRGEHYRLIPIHPMLKKLGFLEFYESVKSRKHERLFPELPYHPTNKYGYLMQKWFNTTYTNKKNCYIETPDTSFHSLRHTFETYLANKLEMPIHKVEVMMGQKPSGGVSTERYIKPIELQERDKYIKRVNFDDCIDFSVIRAWQHQKFAKASKQASRAASTKSVNRPAPAKAEVDSD